MRFVPEHVSRVVVKLGTNTITRDIGQLDGAKLESLALQIAGLRETGIEVIVVSSGAIGLGMGALGLRSRPVDLPALQACAAIGQTILMERWQHALQTQGLIAAQILLTHDDVSSRKRHLAVKETMERLLHLGVVPIVNENDTVSTDEIRFGDNDMLSALVASLTHAELLVILTTVKGLLDRKDSDRLIEIVEEISPDVEALAGGTDSPTAVGGMSSKIAAAKIATESDCAVFIGDGHDPMILAHLMAHRAVGTLFIPAASGLASRKRWIAFFEKSQGCVFIDEGAAKALLEGGRSLLASGVTDIDGGFPSGAVVSIALAGAEPLGRGVVSFSSEEISRIRGMTTAEIRAQFPGHNRLEVIHRNNMVLFKS